MLQIMEGGADVLFEMNGFGKTLLTLHEIGGNWKRIGSAEIGDTCYSMIRVGDSHVLTGH